MSFLRPLFWDQITNQRGLANGCRNRASTASIAINRVSRRGRRPGEMGRFLPDGHNPGRCHLLLRQMSSEPLVLTGISSWHSSPWALWHGRKNFNGVRTNAAAPNSIPPRNGIDASDNVLRYSAGSRILDFNRAPTATAIHDRLQPSHAGTPTGLSR